MLAAALWVVNGGAMPGEGTAVLSQLATPDQLALARQWGLALRRGQRLGGGAADGLENAALAREGGALILSLPRAAEALYADSVLRRHRLLAQAVGLEPALRLR